MLVPTPQVFSLVYLGIIGISTSFIDQTTNIRLFGVCILQRMHRRMSAHDSLKFFRLCSLKTNMSFSIEPKQLNILPVTTKHKRFNCLETIRMMASQRTESYGRVNNHVSQDSRTLPIPRRVHEVRDDSGLGPNQEPVSRMFRNVSVPESRTKISNLKITECFYSQILNTNRGSLHTRCFTCQGARLEIWRSRVQVPL